MNWIRPSTRLAVYIRDRFTCVYCGVASLRLTLDHVRPRAKGGDNAPRNLVTACLSCNSAKGDRTVRSFEPSARRSVRNARRRTLGSRTVTRALLGLALLGCGAADDATDIFREAPPLCQAYCDKATVCHPDIAGVEGRYSDRFCERDCARMVRETPGMGDVVECAQSASNCAELEVCEGWEE